MSTLKVNTLDTRSGTDITVTTGKTVVIPAGATITVAGTQTVTGTVNLASSTLTLPTTLPATAGTNITVIPGANITGTIPLAALGNAPATDLNPLEDDIAVLGFQVAAASDLAQYNLRDQIVDTFQDTSGVDASASTAEIRDATGKYYVGGSSVTPTVTGGTITTDGSYTVHKFTANGTYTTDTAQDVEYLVVAGGGSGGNNGGAATVASGGGGAGEFREGTGFPTTATAYSVTVGAGGTVAGGGYSGNAGGDSIFSTITADGGGGGGANSAAGGAGGSGGGGGTDGAGGAAGPAGPGRYSFVGGLSASGATAAGGGGAGAAGFAAGDSTNPGGAGGGGRQSDILIASTDVYYAGGGGGGKDPQYPGSGGAGGAGGGQPGSTQAAVPAAPANLGGGGGGNGNSSNNGGAGGSGIVVIRRTTSEEVLGSNLTLVSTANTAEAGTTDTGDVVMLYTPATGTTTLNTDLKAYVSRDNGTTYTQATLVGKGSYSGTTEIASTHNLDISAQPAGVTMRWKIETLNQSLGSKVTRINGMSLGWS